MDLLMSKKVTISLSIFGGILLLMALAIGIKPLWINDLLLYGVKNSDERIINASLRFGADPNALDASGCSALVDAISRGHPHIVQLLLRHGADVSKFNNYVDEYPIVLSVMLLRHTEMLVVLLQAGADVNAREIATGKTLLMLAAYFGDIDQLKCLLQYGANVNLEDYDGHDALYYARAYKDSVVAAELEAIIKASMPGRTTP